MNELIYDPLEAFETTFKKLHEENTCEFFDELVARSGIDIAQNRNTLNSQKLCRENTAQLKKKLDRLRFLRVLMCISLVLIPVVVKKTTPEIKAIREEVKNAKAKSDALLSEAKQQMQPLLRLFTHRDSLDLIQKTLPQLTFADNLSAQQEADMRCNFDFDGTSDKDRSTLDVLSGSYNDNPFLFEKTRVHKMGIETYHGYKDIEYTRRYLGSDGKWHTERETQTLHATVTKPKPFYSNQVALNYCHQDGPDLSFSRDATHLNKRSEKDIERLVKRGEKKLDKKAQKALKKNETFMSMSNTDFEVLFDALNRTDEQQFRTLFTPLAQTNMVNLLLSKKTFGDDFDFIKAKRTNRIISKHSQNRAFYLMPGEYASNSYDEIRKKFIQKNTAFFKAVYFDFAPLLAIPAYQEMPMRSLLSEPEPQFSVSLRECEVLVNALPSDKLVHPKTNTSAILKATLVNSGETGDEISVTAYSYRSEKRVTNVPMLGKDMKMHTVPVEWYEYLPLTQNSSFIVSFKSLAAGKKVLAIRNDLCIYQA